MKTDIDTQDLDGIARTIRGWGAAAEQFGEEGLEDAARSVARKAAGVVMSRPGGGTYSRRLAEYSADRGALIRIGGETGRGAEFGSRRGWVFGRVVSADAMSRRQFPRWVNTRDGTQGYVVGRAIRDSDDEITDDLMRGVDEGMRRSARRAGIRTSGKFRG